MFDTSLWPTPVRKSQADTPAEILRFAVDAYRFGRVALATLTEIRGSSARALGSQLAIAENGHYCGYISGGCVEAAVAAEALRAMVEGRDKVVRFGEGSPFFDVVLPCGGGVTVSIHILRDDAAIRTILDHLRRRERCAIAYFPNRQEIRPAAAHGRPGWSNEVFLTSYSPSTMVAISGSGVEASSVRRLAECCDYDTLDLSASADNVDLIDPYTAVVILHHELRAEEKHLRGALASGAFYIGALGSIRTHRRRRERLAEDGFPVEVIDRIKAPIGSFGPTRNAASLALSILADIASTRLMIHG